MTPAQKELARHALGLPNPSRRSYRNRFVASDGERVWKEWQELVGRGAAEARPLSAHGHGRTLFCLTASGARAALNPGERLCPEDFPR
jgi:hypothetical protein